MTGGRIRYAAGIDWVDELWIRDGRVVLPTLQERIDAQLSGRAEEVWLDGATVIPAFRDGHAHPLFAAREAAGLHLTEGSDLDGIIRQIEEYCAANPHLTWIDGATFERGLLAELNDPAGILDLVCAERPVVLHADDHHTLWVNTPALHAAGISDANSAAHLNTKIAHGSIGLMADGRANGVLREWEAMSLVLDAAPKPGLEHDLQALAWAQQELLGHGIVAVQEAWIDPGMGEAWLEFARQNRLMLRVDLATRLSPDNWQEQLMYAVNLRTEVQALGKPKLSANTVKFFADGVFGSATAAVSAPYVSSTSALAPNLGQLVWSREQWLDAAGAANEAGFALHVHAIGDSGIGQTLELFETLDIARTAGATIAHTELVAEGDFERMAEMGVVANFEPYWAQPNAMLLSCLPHLGQERLENLYQMRRAVEAGVRLAFGSDWPVSSVVPLEGIQVAITRTCLDGSVAPLKPEQTLNLAEALAAYSSGSAGQMRDADAGTLSPGQRADFVVLAQDPFEVPASEIAQIRLLATYIDGQPAFER